MLTSNVLAHHAYVRAAAWQWVTAISKQVLQHMQGPTTRPSTRVKLRANTGAASIAAAGGANLPSSGFGDLGNVAWLASCSCRWLAQALPLQDGISVACHLSCLTAITITYQCGRNQRKQRLPQYKQV